MTSTTAGTKGVYRRCNGSATAASHVLLDTGDSSRKTRSPGPLGSASLELFILKPHWVHIRCQLEKLSPQPTINEPHQQGTLLHLHISLLNPSQFEPNPALLQIGPDTAELWHQASPVSISANALMEVGTRDPAE